MSTPIILMLGITSASVILAPIVAIMLATAMNEKTKREQRARDRDPLGDAITRDRKSLRISQLEAELESIRASIGQPQGVKEFYGVKKDLADLLALVWYAMRQKGGETTDWKTLGDQLDNLSAKVKAMAGRGGDLSE